MSERMSERYVRKNVRRYVRNHVRRCARKNVKRYVPKNVGRYARRYSRKNVKRYVRKNVRRYVRKNVRRYVRKICQKICQKSCQKKGQKECQKICQKECQKICQKDVRKNVRRYVRKNVKRYVRKNGKRYVRKNVRRYKDSCLDLVVSILLIASCFFALFGALQRRTAASTVGSTLFLCKEVSLVWQPWRRLWWNVLRRSSLGLPIRWPKELSMCGATSWPLLVLSACTCAWSRLALHMLGIWCLSWKKSWRETSGMWHMKGGLFQMRRASKSWRSALQSFVLRPRFGRMECTSGRQMMCGAEPPTQKKWKNHSGKRRASWFAHAMRCSRGTLNPFACLDSTAVWRGGLMHVVCVCVWNYRRFASLDLTAFWRGGPMHWGRWHLQAQSCHGYYFCCVVWGKYRVCRAAFCVKLWMLGFGFDMSERMSEDMSESMWKDMSEDMSERVSKDLSERMSKDMSERCQKECQKICQKECQKICQKNISEDMSERCQKECQKICQKECQKICQKNISEDMSERMSKDMSERTSEDCFQSVCEVESNGTHFRRWVVCLPSPDPIRLT